MLEKLLNDGSFLIPMTRFKVLAGILVLTIICCVHPVLASATASGNTLYVSGSEDWDSIYSQVGSSISEITYYASNDTYVINGIVKIRINPSASLLIDSENIKFVGSTTEVLLDPNVTSDCSFTLIFRDTVINFTGSGTLWMLINMNNTLAPNSCPNSTNLLFENTIFRWDETMKSGAPEVFFAAGNVSLVNTTIDNVDFMMSESLSDTGRSITPSSLLVRGLYGVNATVTLYEFDEVNVENVNGTFGALIIFGNGTLSNLDVSGNVTIGRYEKLSAKPTVVDSTIRLKKVPVDSGIITPVSGFFPLSYVRFYNVTLVPVDYDTLSILAGFGGATIENIVLDSSITVDTQDTTIFVDAFLNNTSVKVGATTVL